MLRHWNQRGCARVAAGVLTVLVAAGAPALAAMIPIDIVPSASSITAGDTFSVSITADSEQPLVVFGFHLVFDDTLVALDSVAVAAPYKPLHAPNASAGDVAGYAFPDAPSGKQIPLATAVFTALAPGVPKIRIGVTPGSPTEGFFEQGGTDPSEIRVTPTDFDVLPLPTVGGGGGSGPVPEPMTVIFLLGGLAGLGSRRRSR